MFKSSANFDLQKEKLYNKILSLSRNKLLYTKFNISDTFQNRINLIFIHVSFIFVKIKEKNSNKLYKNFYQTMFDFIFANIEINMREIGYSDTSINKNMKFLVKSFYKILLYCENYNKKKAIHKNMFFNNHLMLKNHSKSTNNEVLIKYFDNYQTFCIDLTPESVLKGDLNFNYK